MTVRFALLAFGLLILSLGIPCLAQENPAPTAEPPKATDDAAAEKKGDDKEKSDNEKAAEETDEEEKPAFLRVTRDDDGELKALETAVVRYISADGKRPGVTVDLVGAVHVGDPEYYAELNKLFEEYDAVLFELVAPEGTQIPKGGRKGGDAHPVALLQNGMSSLLELKHQLDQVDYTKENFVHADMTPEEFAKSMEDRGETPMVIFLRLLEQSLVQQAKQKSREKPLPEFNFFTLLFARDRAMQLKRLMAEQFSDMDSALEVFEGPQGSTIVTERNKKAFSVLARELDGGKKKIAIFYGAAHLPDMEKRLVSKFGMKRESEKWISAWRLQ